MTAKYSSHIIAQVHENGDVDFEWYDYDCDCDSGLRLRSLCTRSITYIQ